MVVLKMAALPFWLLGVINEVWRIILSRSPLPSERGLLR